MAIRIVYTFIMAIMLGLNAYAYHETDYRLVYLTCCNSLLLCYLMMTAARKPMVRQQSMAPLPCSKPQLLLMRIGEVLMLTEVVALYGISALAIGKAEIGLMAKMAAVLLHLLAVSICVAFGVMLGNIRSNSREIQRNVQQVPMFIGIVGNVLVTRSIGIDGLALFCPMWWGLTLALTVATAILHPFARRWSM